MNLAICIPISWDFVPTPFVISLTQLMRPGQLKAIKEMGIEKYFYLFNRAFPLDYNRNKLVKKALDLDADWILFLDADMTFPNELVSSLLQSALESGASILSACYFKKLPPHACVSAHKKHLNDPQLLTPIDPLDNRGCRFQTRATELVECDVIGMGAAMIRREVFDAIPYPWFEYEIYEKTGERTVTEDVIFCGKARQAGFSILTDTGLVCGHLRQVEVDDSHWKTYRDNVEDLPTHAVPERKEPA